jgi:uroporphyrinogen decarboxylase
MFDSLEAPSPDDFHPSHELPEEMLRRLQEDAKLLYENTDYAIVCGEMIHDLQLQPGGTASW